MADNPKRDIAYQREDDKLRGFRELIADDTASTAQYRTALDEFCKDYESLLTDTKLLTSLGDRLQRKMRSANLMIKQQSEEIKDINSDLHGKNEELKLTIDELTRAKASRKAQVYVFVLTFLLFVFSEYLENLFDSLLTNTWYYSYAWKIILLLGLKPIESYLEKIFVRQAMDKEKRHLLKKASKNFVTTSLKFGKGKSEKDLSLDATQPGNP